MSGLGEITVVVAAAGPDGKGRFLDASAPGRNVVPGVVEAAYVWGIEDCPQLPERIGAVPCDMSFPLPGGSKFGLISFAPHSAGKLDVRQSMGGQEGDVGVDESDPGMHRSQTIEYEVVIAGKIDIVLEGGERRTLRPGDCLVMGGVMHAWQNRYDQACVYAVVTLGAEGAASRSARANTDKSEERP